MSYSWLLRELKAITIPLSSFLGLPDATLKNAQYPF